MILWQTFHIHNALFEVYFIKSKHFQYVQYGMKKSFFYLVSRQNCSRTCLSGVSWNLISIYSSLKLPGKETVLPMNFISSLCGHCWWKTSLFEDHRYGSLSSWSWVCIEESLAQKNWENFLYMLKNGSLLDINLCVIKLHEFCKFAPKKIFRRMTLISLFIKLNTFNCFPSVDITLQECSQDNNTVYMTSR